MMPTVRTVACVLSTAASTSHAQNGVLGTPLTGGGEARGLMFDLTSPSGVWIDRFQLHLSEPLFGSFTGELWVREGSYQGHTGTAEGWVRHGAAFGSSAGPGGWSPSNYCLSTPLVVPPGGTVGVFLTTSVPQIYTPIPPAQGAYSTPELELRGGVAKAGGAFTDPDVPAAMIGIQMSYATSGHCYANCDWSQTPPVLNVVDFGCFLSHVAAGSIYANCDCSTGAPVINVLDYMCFINQFAAGCS